MLMKRITLFFALILTVLSASAQYKAKSDVLKQKYHKTIDSRLFVNNRIAKTPFVAVKADKSKSKFENMKGIRSFAAKNLPTFETLKEAKLQAADSVQADTVEIPAYMNHQYYSNSLREMLHRYMEPAMTMVYGDSLIFYYTDMGDQNYLFGAATYGGKSGLEEGVDSFVINRQIVASYADPASGRSFNFYLTNLDVDVVNDSVVFFPSQEPATAYLFDDKTVYIPNILGIADETGALVDFIQYDMEYMAREGLDEYMTKALIERQVDDYEITATNDTVDILSDQKYLTDVLLMSYGILIRDFSPTSAENDLGRWTLLNANEDGSYSLEQNQYIATIPTATADYEIFFYDGLDSEYYFTDVTFLGYESADSTSFIMDLGGKGAYVECVYMDQLYLWTGTYNDRITIFYDDAAAYLPVTISDAGYATFNNDYYSFELPEGLKAKAVVPGEKGLQMTDVDYLPMSYAVLLATDSKKGATFNLKLSEREDMPEAQNNLMGSFIYDYLFGAEDSGAENYSFYKLAYSSKKDRFGWFWENEDGTAFYPSMGKAVLVLPHTEAAAARNFLAIDADEATGIQTLKSAAQEANTLYNLNGQRVKNTQKGLFILNNKKVIIK